MSEEKCSVCGSIKIVPQPDDFVCGVCEREAAPAHNAPLMEEVEEFLEERVIEPMNCRCEEYKGYDLTKKYSKCQKCTAQALLDKIKENKA